MFIGSSFDTLPNEVFIVSNKNAKKEKRYLRIRAFIYGLLISLFLIFALILLILMSLCLPIYAIVNPKEILEA